MSGFTDVEQFVKEHRSCGTLTPRTSAPVGGAYLLMVSCSCGKTFERWVNVEDSEGKPLVPSPTPAAEPPKPEPKAIDITAASAVNESLEDVMQKALDAIDTKAPTEETPTTSAAAPTHAAETPTREAPALTRDTSTPTREATTPPRETGKPAPRRDSAPARATTPPPVSTAPPSAARREAEAPKPDRRSLEDALRATLDALGDDAEVAVETNSRATRTPSPATREPRQEAQPAASSTEPASPGSRPTPDKHALQDVLRATLSALEDERKTTARAPRGGVPVGALPGRETAPRRRTLSVGAAVAIVLALGAAVGAGYGLSVLGHRAADIGTSSAKAAPRVRVSENERAVVAQTISVLRDLQSVSRVDVPFRIYFNRVAFAKGDVERGVESVKDPEIRAAFNETIALHLLAATAWRAKTLNEREKWEAVGDDPSAELCPALKRMLAVADVPENMSRSQWRGIALAAGVPLLWDCAAARLTDIERGLSHH
jgi:hypothetical protein